jgi:hypothetical protein
MGNKYKSELNNEMKRIMSEEIEKELTLKGLKTRLGEAVKSKNATPGISNTERVLKQSGRDNKEYIDSVVKKVKDYLKFDGNSNPEFPHQEQSKTDYTSPMYRNSTEQEEYVDTWRGGGLSDLEYDTEPSDEFKDRFSKYLEGSSETGNSSYKGTDGEDVGNVVNVKKDTTGEKIKKILKRKHEKLQGKDGVAISNKIFQRLNPGFIPEQATPGMDSTEEEALVDEIQSDVQLIQDWCNIPVDGNPEGAKTTQCIKKLQKELGLEENGELSEELMDGLETLTQNVTESVNYDMNNIKHLFSYNKKTQ